MKRTLFIVAVLVTFAATGASAAILSVVSDKTTYNVGETITLTAIGDDGGLAGPFYSAYGALQYSGALTDAGATHAANPIGTGWTVGTLPFDDVSATAFDELNFNGGTGDSLAPAGTPFATVTLIAAAQGLVNVTWRQGDLVWFDLNPASAVGTSFQIFQVVPEPTTAALLGLGLVGLALGGRRRS